MRAYVLIEAKVGMARDISERLRGLPLREARMPSVDVVTGPYDVIALLEAEDLDQLAGYDWARTRQRPVTSWWA